MPTYPPGTKASHKCSGMIGTVGPVHEKMTQTSGETVYIFNVPGKLEMFIAEKNVIPLPSKAPKKSIVEWTDPLTGKMHTCPEHFVPALQQHLGKGKTAAILASEILQLMGEQITESNKRHLRAAALYLKQSGTPVISVRSGDGGYFVATAQTEVDDYVAQQHKLADSMKAEADSLAKMFSMGTTSGDVSQVSE